MARLLKSARMTLVLLMAAALFPMGCGPQGPAGAASRQMAAGDFRDIIRGAKDKVFPAVIFIKTIRESYESGKKISEEIAGSGVIISDKGEALSNWHVVDKAIEIRCLLSDGQAFDAKVLGKDKDIDLALLQLSTTASTKPLKYARLGDSRKLTEGDFVMAMGAPYGLSRSVSNGIISCTTRYLPELSEYSLWLQTDAHISPGNSGGPLLNTEGEVIGINARGTSRGGEMGFAIPSETIKDILGQLREHGQVNWSWTGLQLQPLKDFDRNMYFEGTQGVIVAETDQESPARRAGVQPRDRIMKVNGKPVKAMWAEDLPALRRELGLLPKLKPIKVELLRGDKTVTVDVTPREKGKVEGEELDCPRWNMTVKAINQFDNPSLYFYRKTGVFIFGIKYPGNASAAGLGQEDIITKIDDKEVTTLDEVKAIYKDAVANVAAKHRAVFVVLRNGLMKQIVMDFSRDYEKE
ncbi:MAG: trypsin-like peptidase domain-containing protein [Phycisphaerae bacterium]